MFLSPKREVSTILGLKPSSSKEQKLYTALTPARQITLLFPPMNTIAPTYIRGFRLKTRYAFA